MLKKLIAYSAIAIGALVAAYNVRILQLRYWPKSTEHMSMGHVIDHLAPQASWVDDQGRIYEVDKVDRMFVHYHSKDDGLQHRVGLSTFVDMFNPIEKITL